MRKEAVRHGDQNEMCNSPEGDWETRPLVLAVCILWLELYGACASWCSWRKSCPKSTQQPPLCKYGLRPKIWFGLSFSSFIWEMGNMCQIIEGVARVSIFWDFRRVLCYMNGKPVLDQPFGSSQWRAGMQTLAVLCWKESVFSQALVSFSFFCQQCVIC